MIQNVNFTPRNAKFLSLENAKKIKDPSNGGPKRASMENSDRNTFVT